MIQYHELKRATTTAKTKVAKVRVDPKTFVISNPKHSPRLESQWQLLDKLSVLPQSHLQKLLVFRKRLHFVNTLPARPSVQLASPRKIHVFHLATRPSSPPVPQVSSEISDLCEISDLLLFFSYFASQNKETKSGNTFLHVCCVN